MVTRYEVKRELERVMKNMNTEINGLFIRTFLKTYCSDLSCSSNDASYHPKENKIT
jgi:hypothetical protein